MHRTLAYSIDLREVVVGAVRAGLKKQTAVKRYGVSMSTINRWLLLDTKNKLIPKKDWKKGHSHKIKDLEVFKNFVDKNNSLTLWQLAKKWGNISAVTIRAYLHKIGYTKKKDRFYMQSAMKKNEKNSKKS